MSPASNVTSHSPFSLANPSSQPLLSPRSLPGAEAEPILHPSLTAVRIWPPLRLSNSFLPWSLAEGFVTATSRVTQPECPCAICDSSWCHSLWECNEETPKNMTTEIFTPSLSLSVPRGVRRARASTLLNQGWQGQMDGG